MVPYNVFAAVDIFGYVCWNTNNTGIGQQLEHLAKLVDYLSPMVYPSGYKYGIPGCRDPVSHPYEVVRDTLENARKRVNIPAKRFRPWLQGLGTTRSIAEYSDHPKWPSKCALRTTLVQMVGCSGTPTIVMKGWGLNLNAPGIDFPWPVLVAVEGDLREQDRRGETAYHQQDTILHEILLQEASARPLRGLKWLTEYVRPAMQKAADVNM